MHRRILAEHKRTLAAGTGLPGWLRAFALALAAIVHVSTLGAAAAAVLVWWTPLFVVVKVVVSAVLVLAIWETRPRLSDLGNLPVLDRDIAPHTFALLDRVCAAAGARPIDVVVLTSSFNAGTGFVGIRRRRCVLSIGLPMWNVLCEREKVALLGHEVGHLVNGDFRDLMLVSTALSTLARWQWLLTPERFFVYVGSSGGGGSTLADTVTAILLLPLSLLMSAFATMLDRVASLAGQRAEYRADALAATIGGRAATTELFDRFYFADATLFAMKVALRAGDRADIWAVGRSYLAEVPESERERVRRNGERTLHRTDDSHPPTPLRLALLSAVSDTPAAVELRPEQERLIDAELMIAEPWVRERLIEGMAR